MTEPESSEVDESADSVLKSEDLESSKHERRSFREEATELKTISDLFKAIARFMTNTSGLMYALLFVFTVSFTLFPGVMDATNLKLTNGLN